MRRIIAPLAISAIVATGLLAGSASASGPAPPGKEIIEIECAGLGSVTVSVQRPEHSRGAGQIVGTKGHGIPTAIVFTLTDVTTGAVLVSEQSTVGGGHAHPHQPATPCKATNFEGPASVFFEGHELPPGVEPGDLIRATTEVQVIVKR
jgi:hypothetical protein